VQKYHRGRKEKRRAASSDAKGLADEGIEGFNLFERCVALLCVSLFNKFGYLTDESPMLFKNV
jgi:hypothetical protein